MAKQYNLTRTVFAVLIRPSTEHGYLMQPPSRSSAWRFGFDTPPNYNDNQLNCGGYGHQWGSQDGKCGECGDPWDGVRHNQAGGTYATGTIVGNYQPGEVIEVIVKITANHKGWFQFRLCPVNDYTQPVTWQCLNETVLELEDGSTKVYISDEAKDFYYNVRLPEITCSQCVLQWMWHCGNSQGTFPNGTACVGCGPQEQFYGCADISIGDSSATTTAGATGGSTAATTNNPETTTTTEGTTTQPESTTTTQPGSTTTTEPNEYDCFYIGDTGNTDDMDAWCNVNCNHSTCNCPSDCDCEPEKPC